MADPTPSPPTSPGGVPAKKRKFGDKTGAGSSRRLPMRRAKAAAMIAEKIAGKTDQAIAHKFNVHPKTVRNTFTWAENHGMLDKYEQRLIDELVPLAIEAYRTALKQGDTYVATEVLKGSGILKKQVDRNHDVGTDDEVLVWVKKRQERHQIDITPTDPSRNEGSGPTSLALPEPPPTIEATVSAIDGESGMEGAEGNYDLADDDEGEGE